MNESRATRYQRGKRRAQSVAVVCGGLLLTAVALTPLGRTWSDWCRTAAQALPGPLAPVAATSLFVVGLVGAWEAALLPAMWYSRGASARGGGQPTTIKEALAAQGLATLVALPAALVAAFSIQIAVAAVAGWWWALSGSMVATALIAVMHGAPAVFARVAGARPVQRPELIERLGALSRRIHVPIASIEAVPDPAATLTALVAGAGNARRVFISADLLRDWTDAEIAVVVAHEFGHHSHHDLWRTLALDAAVLSTGFFASDRLMKGPGAALGLPSVGDPAGLPVVALTVATIWLAATPLRHAVSRRQERRADAFALSLTGSPAAFGAAIRRLAARHLAEERPSRLVRWFYHRHPSVAERLSTAEAFRRTARSDSAERPLLR